MNNKNRKAAYQLIDEWLKYQIMQGVVPGLQLAIRQNGNLVFSKSYGLSNIKRNKKYTTAHLGRIASQSKTITAALSIYLIAKKKFKLSDTVVSILPEFKKHKDSKFKKVKIVDLLSHRSGIHRDSYTRDYWGTEKKFLSKMDLVEEVLSNPLVYTPGKFTKYSNLNYAILGLIFERVSGLPYDKLVKSFFKEIGIKNIFADYDAHLDLAQGYIRRQSKAGTFESVSHRTADSLAPGAGFCASAESISEFFHRIYLTNSIFSTKQRKLILNSKWLVKNTKTDFYGLGTIFLKVGSNKYIGHSGGYPGFTSNTYIEEKTKFSYSFITNTSLAKSFNIIHCMAEIMRIIKANFSGNDSLKVSVPMADNFISTIYVVGKKRALAFPLTGWNPTEDVKVFRKHKDHFISHAMNGFENLGEPLRFEFKLNKIAFVQLGGFKSKPVR